MSRQCKIGSRLKEIAGAALIASASLVAAPLLPTDHSQAFAQAQPQAQPQPQAVADDVRAVLSQYGNFVQHQVYGEVWIPSVTPQGWHPYPACHWVNTKQFGWYYDDKT